MRAGCPRDTQDGIECDVPVFVLDVAQRVFVDEVKRRNARTSLNLELEESR